jgi:hypothetical protein
MTVNAARRTRRRTPAASAPEIELAPALELVPESTPASRRAPMPAPAFRPTPASAFTPRMVPGDSLTIGEINQTVFDCPVCSRPLALGAGRCPGCSTRLVNGVRLSKASAFVAAGLAIGLLAGAGAGFLIGSGQAAAAPAAGLMPLASPAESGDPIVASVAPSPSATAVPATPTPSADPGSGSSITPAARAALIQVIGANDQLTVARSELQSALASRIFDASDVARILRSVSADSVQAEQLAIRVAAWSGSAAVGSQLGAFYGTIHDAAAEALVASVQNSAAYRTAATSMVGLLADIPAIDAAVRSVAAEAGVTVPEAASAGASTAP